MSNDTHPLLAREGWAHVSLVAVAALAVQYFAGGLYAAPLWLALLFVLQFFRDPSRAIPGAPGLVTCPADGRVIAVGDVDDP